MNIFFQLGLYDTGNILSYWRDKEKRWPALAAMARDHLGVPATLVGPERVFSIGRDVVPYRRCHLKPEKIRKLMMIRHYMKARANAAADEDDDEELDGDVRYESVAVRRDLGWA